MLEAQIRYPLDEMPINLTFIQRLSYRERMYRVKQARELKTSEDRREQYRKLGEMIGNTPLIRIPVDGKGTIFAKVESDNPTESHYDRTTLVVISRLEKEGLIKPGDTILEGTSGSAGRSFAYFCNRLEFKLNMIVPHLDEFPKERERDIAALGANIIHAQEKGGINKVISHFRRTLVELRRSGYERKDYVLEGKQILIFKRGDEVVCAPNHSEIIITPEAFENIAKEVIQQLPAGVKIDTFVGTLGNGSTIKGISEVLREEFGDNVAIIGTETRNAPINAIRKLRAEVGEERLRQAFLERYGFRMPEKNEQAYHDSFGASTPGYEPPFVDVRKINGIVLVEDEWRVLKDKRNIRAYGMYDDTDTIGNTSAENLWVGTEMIKQRKAKNVLTLFYDKADQYRDWPPLSYRPFPDMADFVRVARIRNSRRTLATSSRGAL